MGGGGQCEGVVDEWVEVGDECICHILQSGLVQSKSITIH